LFFLTAAAKAEFKKEVLNNTAEAGLHPLPREVLLGISESSADFCPIRAHPWQSVVVFALPDN
jgi:hypothetical protein